MKVKLGDGVVVDADVLDALGFAFLSKGFSQQEITKKVRELSSDLNTLLNALHKEGLIDLNARESLSNDV